MEAVASLAELVVVHQVIVGDHARHRFIRFKNLDLAIDICRVWNRRSRAAVRGRHRPVFEQERRRGRIVSRRDNCEDAADHKTCA